MAETRTPTPAQKRALVDALELAKLTGNRAWVTGGRRDVIQRLREAGWIEQDSRNVTDAGRIAAGEPEQPGTTLDDRTLEVINGALDALALAQDLSTVDHDQLADTLHRLLRDRYRATVSVAEILAVLPALISGRTPGVVQLPTAARPTTVHEGLAVNEHGVPLRTLTGALHLGVGDEDGNGNQIMSWQLAGRGDTFNIGEDDVPAAQSWAAAHLADSGYPVAGWTHHTDRYGDWWMPVYATTDDPDVDLAGTGTVDTEGKTFTREPRYPDYPVTTTDPDAETVIVVDTERIGGVYRAAKGKPGDPTYDGLWISWGPAGLSAHHPTREAAEDAQIVGHLRYPVTVDVTVKVGKFTATPTAYQSRAASTSHRDLLERAEEIEAHWRKFGPGRRYLVKVTAGESAATYVTADKYLTDEATCQHCGEPIYRYRATSTCDPNENGRGPWRTGEFDELGRCGKAEAATGEMTWHEPAGDDGPGTGNPVGGGPTDVAKLAPTAVAIRDFHAAARTAASAGRPPGSHLAPGGRLPEATGPVRTTRPGPATVDYQIERRNLGTGDRWRSAGTGTTTVLHDDQLTLDTLADLIAELESADGEEVRATVQSRTSSRHAWVTVRGINTACRPVPAAVLARAA